MLLVLGASSYIGSRLFQALGLSIALGTYNRNPVPGAMFFDATSMSLRDTDLHRQDISHAFVVFAEPDVDACKADIERSRDINIRSTNRVIDDLQGMGIKPIFMSSEYVFDGERGNYSEEDPASPTTVYGSQKLEIEKKLSQSGGDYAVLRLAKVYGSDPGDGTILSGWHQQIDQGEVIRCARDQVFSPVHIGDVVAASIEAAKLDLSGVYHIAGPEPVSRLDLLRRFLEHLGSDARVDECNVNDIDFLDRRPLNLSMRPQKILDATGLSFRNVDSCCREFARKSGQSTKE